MLFFALILATFVVIYFCTSVIIVQQQETVIVERLGQYYQTLEPGLHFIFSPIDKARPMIKIDKARTLDGRSYTTQTYAKRIDLRETVYDFPCGSYLQVL